jgi:hypothetical protein
MQIRDGKIRSLDLGWKKFGSGSGINNLDPQLWAKCVLLNKKEKKTFDESYPSSSMKRNGSAV